MVTTTGTGENTVVLLEEATARLKKLMEGPDFPEDEIREVVLSSLSLVLNTVAPTVKLIDKQFSGYEGPKERGIFLARIGLYGVYFTRQGMVHWVSRSPYSRTVEGFVSALDERFRDNTYELIQAFLNILAELSLQYTVAVRGNEGRHRWLTATKDKLVRGFRPFEPIEEVQISIPPYE